MFEFDQIDSLMANVYETRKDADGFLYIIYTDESTYGGEEQWSRACL